MSWFKEVSWRKKYFLPFPSFLPAFSKYSTCSKILPVFNWGCWIWWWNLTYYQYLAKTSTTQLALIEVTNGRLPRSSAVDSTFFNSNLATKTILVTGYFEWEWAIIFFNSNKMQLLLPFDFRVLFIFCSKHNNRN